MPAFERNSPGLVIAGASSLLGAELKSLLEEGPFAGWEFRLVDEEMAAGTLTQAGGEPVVIQAVKDDTFEKARLIFFTGSAEFSESNLAAALRSGGKVLDLSGRPAGRAAAFPCFAEPAAGEPGFSGTEALFSVYSAAAAGSVLLSRALQAVGLKRLLVTCFQSASEAGRDGVEELEAQTSKLLSFQPIGKALFDAQIAFTLLSRYGHQSRRTLGKDLQKIREQVKQALGPGELLPSVMLLHAPVFYGTTFSACAELDPVAGQESILGACQASGFALSRGEEPVGHVSAAGQNRFQLSLPEADPAAPGTWWFWGAADNLRYPAWNAVRLAERLI